MARIRKTQDIQTLADLRPMQERLMRLLADWTGPELPILSTLAPLADLAGEGGVRFHLMPLIEAGCIERYEIGPGLPKVPRLTGKGYRLLGISIEPGHAEPDILGIIKNAPLAHPMPKWDIICGPPEDTDEEPEYLERLSDIFRSLRDDDYILEARGFSMCSPKANDYSIGPGDRVLVRPHIWPADGEIVHAEYAREDGIHEKTLKVFSFNERQRTITLKALNPRYPKIVRPADRVCIKGIVVEIIRHVECLNRK